MSFALNATACTSAKKKEEKEEGREKISSFRFEIFCIKSRTRIGLWRVSVSDSLISVIARGLRNLEGKEGRDFSPFPFSTSSRDVKKIVRICQRTKVKHVSFFPKNYNDGVSVSSLFCGGERKHVGFWKMMSSVYITLGKISGDLILNSKIIG